MIFSEGPKIVKLLIVEKFGFGGNKQILQILSNGKVRFFVVWSKGGSGMVDHQKNDGKNSNLLRWSRVEEIGF